MPIDLWKGLSLDEELINISKKFLIKEYDYICDTVQRADYYINEIKNIKTNTDDLGILFEKKSSLLMKYVKENFVIEDLEN